MPETTSPLDPDVPRRVTVFLDAWERIGGADQICDVYERGVTAYPALGVADLRELLKRDVDARRDGEQLAEACARYRHERDEARVRVAELELVPRCGAMTASAFINAEPLGPCILDHGHGGMHQEASRGMPPVPGAQWTERNGPLAVAHARIRELEAELAGFETAWGVRYAIAKTMDSDAEPDQYTTERENEADARQWRDEYAPHGEIVTCRYSTWAAVDEAATTPTENGSTVE